MLPSELLVLHSSLIVYVFGWVVLFSPLVGALSLAIAVLMVLPICQKDGLGGFRSLKKDKRFKKASVVS